MLNESELPKLPDGWEWLCSDVTRSGYCAINKNQGEWTKVGFFAGRIEVSTSYAVCFIQPEVIVAVLKANGVEL